MPNEDKTPVPSLKISIDQQLGTGSPALQPTVAQDWIVYGQIIWDEQIQNQSQLNVSTTKYIKRKLCVLCRGFGTLGHPDYK